MRETEILKTNINENSLHIATLNCAAWRWRKTKDSYESRLKKICKFIKTNTNNPFVIALQEVIVGMKYYEVIKFYFKDYRIVLPKGYDLIKNKKSAISILLVNEKLTKEIYTYDLHYDPKFRYNFVKIISGSGLAYNIFNVHIPQTYFVQGQAEWYVQKRKLLKSNLENKILSTAQKFRHSADAFIIVGDFNAVPDSEFIHNLATTSIDTPMFNASLDQIPTWQSYDNIHFTKKLDYIFYSYGMVADYQSSYICKPAKTLQGSIYNNLSDHAVVVAEIEENIA